MWEDGDEDELQHLPKRETQHATADSERDFKTQSRVGKQHVLDAQRRSAGIAMALLRQWNLDLSDSWTFQLLKS